jgi:hypothetical protein
VRRGFSSSAVRARGRGQTGSGGRGTSILTVVGEVSIALVLAVLVENSQFILGNVGLANLKKNELLARNIRSYDLELICLFILTTSAK